MVVTTLVRGMYVLVRAALDGGSELLRDGAVVVNDGVVGEADQYTTLRERYPAAEVLGDGRQFLLPGLVNAHQHGGGVSGTQLGHTDGHLETWLLGSRRSVDPYLQAMYGVMQQVRSGTTTLMLNAGGSRATIDATLRAFEEIGPRVAYSASFSSQSALIYGDDDAFIASLPAELQTRVRAELMPPSRTPIGEYLARSLDLKRSYESARPGHVRILLAPSGYQWATEAELKQIAETAERENMGVHTHIAETAYERVAAERTTGQTPVQRMQAVGLTGPKISFAHCAWINEADMDILAETGTSVSHNPGSNLRLHAGIAPVRDMLAHGVTVGLGTDNGGINDDDDMLQEIGLSQRLHRPPGLREQHVTADQLLHMATMGGAVTTTFGAEMIGSLEPGKQADLVLIDWDRVESPYLDPSVAPLDALVARARSRDVNTVMVGGRVVYQDGRFPGIDEDGIVGALRERLAGPVPPELEANRRLVEELEPHVVRFYDDWELPMGSSFERRNAR